MKSYKILPSVNNIDFCGRVLSEPRLSKTGNVMYFELIRNFGGGKAPVIMEFVYFKPKNGFPSFIKKGAPVIAHAYVSPVSYEKDGKPVEEVQKVIKKVEEAELVIKQYADNEEAPEEAEAVEVKES